MSSSISTIAPLHPDDPFAGWQVARARPAPVAAQRAINPFLIFVALVYVAWSYFHLPSSIWARLVLASYLIWRMRPDIVIPYCLSCIQLRLNLRLLVEGMEAGLEDVYADLTGFESYAFAIPPVLMIVRTVIAMFDARVNRDAFPKFIGLAWMLAGVLVFAGAIYAKTLGFGWTASLRMYAIVGCALYGMLMPRLDQRELKRLAGAMAILGAILSLCAIYSIYGSQLLFLLAPLTAVWGVSGLLSREKPIYSAFLLAISGAFCLLYSTFMLALTWMWCASAGFVEQAATQERGAAYKRMHAFVLVTFLCCVAVFMAGFTRHIEDRAESDATVLGRLEAKLYKDRGPLWVGFLHSMYEEPSFLPVPGRAFMIRSFGKDTLWRNGPHNMILELLRQMGLIVGPVCVAVLASLVIRLTRVIAYDTGRGGRAIATAAISAIMVGGVTLPFVLADRQGEIILIAAGLVVASCWRGPVARTQLARR